jgi:hypothetical protein
MKDDTLAHAIVEVRHVLDKHDLSPDDRMKVLAPEMLAELECLVRATRIILGRMGELADASQQAATLIAKARGQ